VTGAAKADIEKEIEIAAMATMSVTGK